MFAIFKSIWSMICTILCTVLPFLVISKKEPSVNQKPHYQEQTITSQKKKQKQNSKIKQQPKVVQQKEQPKIPKESKPHSVSSLVPELSSQSPDSSVASYSVEQKEQNSLINFQEPLKQQEITPPTKTQSKFKNPIVKSQSNQDDDSWVQIDKKKPTHKPKVEEIKQELKIEEPELKQIEKQPVIKSLPKKQIEQKVEVPKVEEQKIKEEKPKAQSKLEKKEETKVVAKQISEVKPPKKVEIEETFTPRIVEAIKIIPSLMRPQDAKPEVNTEGKQFFGKFKRLSTLQIQRKIAPIEKQIQLVQESDLSIIEDLKNSKPEEVQPQLNETQEIQPLSIETEERKLQFIRDTIQAQYINGRNNEHILTFETLISIMDASADLIKNKYSDFITQKRKQRRELLKNKDYENYAHYVVEMSIKLEEMLHDAYEEVSHTLNVDSHVFEKSYVHYINPEGQSDEPATEEEEEMTQQLIDRAVSVQQELKQSLKTSVDLSLSQGQEILSHQINIVKHFKENEFFKQIIPYLDHSEDHQELLPTVLGYVLEDIIYERFQCEEEDKLKFIKENAAQQTITKLLVELDEASQIFCDFLENNIEEQIQ